MKGPGFRLDLDVRRVWECPACGKRLKLSGDVTQVACDCRGEASPAMRLVERLRRTESPFDHVGFAAQKRIDAAIRRPHGPPLPESDEERQTVPESIPGSDADLRPPEATLPETTHAIDADAPPILEPTTHAPSDESATEECADAEGDILVNPSPPPPLPPAPTP